MMEGEHKQTKRLSKFLSHYDFHPNNINFRILSSKAIEKWKNVQAFQLNQITNGKFHFHAHKREILLLKYDLWSLFIYETENLMIDLSSNDLGDEITPEDIDHIIDLADKTTRVYKDILLEDPNHRFNTGFVNIWLEAHELACNLMLNQLKGLSGFSYDIAFTGIVDIVTAMMQYTLFELHELNSLLCFFGSRCSRCFPEEDRGLATTPFMVITNLEETSFALTNQYLVFERYKIYKKYMNIRSIYFKNYLNGRIPHEIFDKFEEDGVDIQYKLNF